MIEKWVHLATQLTKGFALIVMTCMMFFIAFAVISRGLHFPIIGDVELVQIGMVILVMCGLAYTQFNDAHISIDFIVDKFGLRGQLFCAVFANLLTVLVTFIIGIIYVRVAINHKESIVLTTDLLHIPFYPFDFIIVIGFILWGMEALLKLIQSIVHFIHPNQKREEV